MSMNTRRIRAASIFALILFHPLVSFSQDQCRTCHESIEDPRALAFAADIHASNGISCADCHGGDRTKEDMEEGMSAGAGFRGVPVGDAISDVCASCHSDASKMVHVYKSTLPLDQVEALKASVHGQQSVSGRSRIAQCTSCHGAHGILPRSNRKSPVHPANVPTTCARCHSNAGYMTAYDPSMPVDQFQKYRSSVHGKLNQRGDSKVAECASCHGSHDILAAKDVRSKVYPINLPATCGSCHADAVYMRGYGIGTDQLKEYSKSVHGVALLQKHDIGAPACNDCHGNHGAVPPGVESISKVCGSCHALNADLFSKSPHKKAFDTRGLPECETCHGNHEVVRTTDQLLGVGKEAVCAWCHKDDTKSRGHIVAATMRQLADSLADAEDSAQRLLNDAEQKGMEVGEARFAARSIRQARLESRTKVHSFQESQFRDVVEKGLSAAKDVSAQAEEAIGEYHFRRWGLLIASFAITLLAVSLYLLIRRIESRQRAK